MNLTTEQRDFITRWVAALRSGEHRQGNGSLRPTAGTYCCLGVACNLYDPTRWDYNTTRWDADYLYLAPDGSPALPRGEASWLTGDIAAALGLDIADQRELAIMNDEGKPFEFIADYIESKYLNDEPAIPLRDISPDQ